MCPPGQRMPYYSLQSSEAKGPLISWLVLALKLEKTLHVV